MISVKAIEREIQIQVTRAVKIETQRCLKICEYWTKQNEVYLNGALRCGKDIAEGKSYE